MRVRERHMDPKWIDLFNKDYHIKGVFWMWNTNSAEFCFEQRKHDTSIL